MMFLSLWLVKKKIKQMASLKTLTKDASMVNRSTYQTVNEDLNTFAAELPKYTSHYGREKSANVLTLGPGVTKSKLWTEFLSDKNYTVSLEWFNKYWHKNMPVKLYSNYTNTCDICSCYCTVPRAIWEIFSHILQLEIIAKYEKRGKYLPILHEATCDNYFIVKCLFK